MTLEQKRILEEQDVSPELIRGMERFREALFFLGRNAPMRGARVP